MIAIIVLLHVQQSLLWATHIYGICSCLLSNTLLRALSSGILLHFCLRRDLRLILLRLRDLRALMLSTKETRSRVSWIYIVVVGYSVNVLGIWNLRWLNWRSSSWRDAKVVDIGVNHQLNCGSLSTLLCLSTQLLLHSVGESLLLVALRIVVVMRLLMLLLWWAEHEVSCRAWHLRLRGLILALCVSRFCLLSTVIRRLSNLLARCLTRVYIRWAIISCCVLSRIWVVPLLWELLQVQLHQIFDQVIHLFFIVL